MPNTTKLALPYPQLSDTPNVPAHLQALTGAFEATGVQVLGVASNGTNVGSNSTVVASGTTGWPTIISVTVTVPVGLTTARRIFVLGYAQMGISVVGNVEAGLFQGSDYLHNGSDPRIPNSGTSNSYGNMFWGVAGAGAAVALPAAGNVTYALKAKNNAAGSWTSFAHTIAVVLI